MKNIFISLVLVFLISCKNHSSFVNNKSLNTTHINVNDKKQFVGVYIGREIFDVKKFWGGNFKLKLHLMSNDSCYFSKTIGNYIFDGYGIWEIDKNNVILSFSQRSPIPLSTVFGMGYLLGTCKFKIVSPDTLIYNNTYIHKINEKL